MSSTIKTQGKNQVKAKKENQPVQPETVIPQDVTTSEPVQAVSLTKEQIKAQAKAQLEAIKLLEKQAKEQAKALKENAKNEANIIKAESLKDLYSIESQYGVMQGDEWMDAKNSIIAIQALASGFNGAVQALKQAEIDQAKKAKIQSKLDELKNKQAELLAQLNEAVAEEYDSKGNEIINLNMPQSHADILNAIADNLSPSVEGMSPTASIASFRMTKAHTASLKTLLEQAYIIEVDSVEKIYTFTDKGLDLFHTNWEQVNYNLEAMQIAS
jgi:hypothetical protein